METSQSRINQILAKHNELMIAYEKILQDFEDKKIFDSLELINDNPSKYFKSKDIGLIEKSQLYLNYFSFHNRNESTTHQLKSLWLFLTKRKKFSWLQQFTEKKKFFPSMTQYLIKTHIRRQLSQLSKFYIRELISQNTQKNSDEIKEFREVTNTLKDYVDELPNIRRLFTTTASILFGLVSTGQFFGLNQLLYDSLTTQIDYVLAMILSIPILVVFIISEIFLRSFRIKRCAFMQTSSIYPYYDLYFGQGKQIYESSIYKLENDLYEKLGKKNKKPKEIPIDKIFQLLLPGSFSLFLTILMTTGIFISLIYNTVSAPWYVIIFGMSILSLMTYGYFIMPFIKYNRRKQNNLV